MSRHRIIVCMGSSCFSRGNNRTIEVVKDFAAEHAGDVELEVRGHLCEGQCKGGPNVIIDGVPYGEMNLGLMRALLRRCLQGALA